jgi:tRNA(Ile2) C34 agmatinyltransferase TiaS
MTDATDAARLLAARRRVRPKVCPTCGVTFSAFGRQLYCSNRCRSRASVRAYRARKRATGT